MAERRLDKQTMDVVKKGWNSLLQRYQKDNRSGEYHWTDNEGDVGFLKGGLRTTFGASLIHD